MATESVSVSLLSRYSGIGISAHLTRIAFQICSHFNLSPRGQRVVSNALTNLPVHNIGDDRLSFGFGFAHLLRNQEVNETGFNVTALCGVLAECFPGNYAAAVLDELTKQLEPAVEEDMRPHRYQWRDMVLACDGAFTSSGFGVLVEDSIRLNPFQSPVAKSLADPRDVARALMALWRLSTGSEKHLIIAGGDTIGWFAAIATWLFDLRIKIASEDGAELYSDRGDLDAQLLLIYTQAASSIEYAQKIPTGPAKTPFFLSPIIRGASETAHTTIVPFGGRVIWQSLLPKVFGQSYIKLSQEEDIGTAIGGIARIFQGLVRGEGDLDPNLVSEKNKHTPSSYGTGLVATLTNYLPELRRFAGRMERASKLSWAEAVKVYPEAIRRMEKVCACKICLAEATRDPEGGFCKVVIVESITALGLALSKMIVTSELYPTRSGLQLFYAEQEQKKISVRMVPQNMGLFLTIYGNGWNAPDAVMLRKCAEIFCGSSPVVDEDEGGGELVALSHEGICAYLIRLEGGSDSDKPGGSSIMRVVPGTIQKGQKVYSRVRDASGFGDAMSWSFWERVESAGSPHAVDCMR